MHESSRFYALSRSSTATSNRQSEGIHVTARHSLPNRRFPKKSTAKGNRRMCRRRVRGESKPSQGRRSFTFAPRTRTNSFASPNAIRAFRSSSTDRNSHRKVRPDGLAHASSWKFNGEVLFKPELFVIQAFAVQRFDGCSVQAIE